ncbi:S-formylglutathione hydrolase isoform X3 [Oratosquilla oratoria]|uniref:S-formylglutathione hydrolase isoform X3 n=1 Tax=Oratosquilla oratoria TaxID=337810 RepID=UPI003F76D0D2
MQDVRQIIRSLLYIPKMKDAPTPKNEWFSEKCRLAKEKKDLMYRRYNRHKSSQAYLRYKEARAEFVRIRREEERNFLRSGGGISGSTVSTTNKMAGIKEESSNKVFGGFQKVCSHDSKELNCRMKFGVFVPSEAESSPVPVMYWLSGLTCTEQNFITKAGAQQHAAKHGLLLVSPDTSPRGCNIEGEDDDWDFGTGAGFYVDATEEKWKTNYRMYSYITKELPQLIAANFNVVPDKMSIMGHSMGGHGALVCALKNPGMYQSVSAFSPICNPTNCPWGIKAFSGYLGTENKDAWKEYDACELVKNYKGTPLQILVDQGKADNFLTQGQLLPDKLVNACAQAGMPIVMRMQEDYDHSYYFIATFMGDHIDHHAKYLKE